MSYYNYIEVDRDEYRRIQREAKESRSLRNRLNRERRKRKSLEKRVNKFEGVVKNLEAQNKKLNESLRSLNSELFNTKKEFEKKFNTLDEKIEKGIEFVLDEVDNLRKETKKELKKQKEAIENIVKRLNLETKNKQKLANYWLENLNAQIDMIKTLKHEKFKPGELDILLNKVEIAKENIKNGVYEAAISSLQERFLEAKELFDEVFLLQKEWEGLREIALENIEDIQDLIEAQRKVEFVIRGKSIEVDVDYWSEGRISKIKKEIEALKKRIDSDDVTTEELVEIIKKEAEIIQELKNLPNVAKDNLILAEARINTANKIIDILDNLGFDAVDDTFEREDKRKTLFLKFENESEEEIIIALSKKNLKNKMNIMFDVGSTNEEMKDLRLQNIIKELNSSGVEISNFKCEDSEVDMRKIEEFKDFEKIKRGEVDTKNL